MFTDVILLTYWCGHVEYALRCLDDAGKIMQVWNPPLDVASWRRQIEELLDRSRMEATLAEEIKKHKVGQLPVFELTEDSPRPPTLAQVYKTVWGSGE